MTPAVLIRISTQEIIKKALYPSKDIVPIPSLEADLKWLIVNELNKPTPIDFSIEKYVRLEEITVIAHPVHTQLDQFRISFTITALTQQEQDDFIQNQEDNDNSSVTIQNHKAAGIVGFDRAMALIQRRFDDATITGPQAKGLAQALYPELEPLYKGMWRLVKMNLDAATPPANGDLLIIFDLIKGVVDDYVTNNF